jgi:quinol monooxygenase YgiN
MLVVHVSVQVLPDCIEAFKLSTETNARLSRQEPGVARFDVVQQVDDPTRFVLVEAYYDEQAPLLHKQTTHYQAWAEAVSPMMAKPRQSVRYQSVSPSPEEWAHTARST